MHSRARGSRGTPLHTFPLVLVQQLRWEFHKAEPGACAGCHGAGAEGYANETLSERVSGHGASTNDSSELQSLDGGAELSLLELAS